MTPNEYHWQEKPNEDLARSLAAGCTYADAAVQASVGESTVYRRMRDPTFVQRVEEIKNNITREISEKLTAAGLKAANVLLDLVTAETTPPAVRLGAARSIIELGVRMRDVNELEGRLRDLEKRFGKKRANSEPYEVYRGIDVENV